MPERLLRVVFDTSVLVSFAGRPAGNYTTWKAVLEGNVIAITCSSALDELTDVLKLQKIRDHYGTALDPVNVDRFIAGFMAIATVLPQPTTTFILKADPCDSLFFNLSIEARADFLVTFDEVHILAVNRPEHPQHSELRLIAPQLKVVKPADLALELTRIQSLKMNR